MADLLEKQYELNGVTFGLDCPVEVESQGFNPGTAALRTADVDRPAGDGIRFGKDYKGSATWGFSLYTNADDEEGAWSALGELGAAWDDEETRLTSEAVVPLRYRLAGRNRRVYGRPRAWTHTPNNQSIGGRIDIEADFATVDGLIYDDDMKSQLIGIAPPLELDAGFTVPFIPPFISSAGASVRESSIRIGGEVATPITVTFFGPVESATVRIGGWTAALVDPVVIDDPVTIDARPWVRAATKQSGGGVRVSPRVTRISKMWLPPGVHEVVYTGEDPTSTASVLVSWHDAYRMPR